MERWAAARKKPALIQMGVDEIYLGKKQKFITVVSNLDTAEPLWFGQERKKETVDEFFTSQLNPRQANTHHGGLCGYVGAVSPQHRTVGAETAESSATNSTPCNKPTGRSARCGERSSFATDLGCEVWSEASAGSC
jgi:hypothetical protein